ncbi:unnamed protein product [Adineta steineri]|uniref:EF-hand domain-containing protein n=1 Tax=Adineta steineri TaxID=433720 RepID=A0A814K2G4_9BILA|nr:unnamed protein product [Adineta steineri]CAF3814513.1 unnamed protein product [Adineta steineri]
MPPKRSKEEIKKLFKSFDNGNGHLSLAEIDRAVTHYYPDLGTNKKAIMRAYKAADNGGNGFIELKEFAKLIEVLGYYDDLSKKFAQLDKDGDHRISFTEFKKGFSLLNQDHLDDQHLKKEFNNIDKNGGGFILFDEFCMYMANRQHGEDE